jgi:hypothetical protein
MTYPKVTHNDITRYRYIPTDNGIDIRISFKKDSEKGCIVFGPFADKKDAKKFYEELRKI